MSARVRLLPVLLVIAMACACAPRIPPSPAAGEGGKWALATGAHPDLEDFDNDGEDDFDKAWGPEFEIDADANGYFGIIPKQVAFAAKALNGKPPFTFTWDFGDGSPSATGPSVTHTFTKVGRTDVVVIGRDANGETSRVQLILVLLTPEEYARRNGLNQANPRPDHPRPAAKPAAAP